MILFSCIGDLWLEYFYVKLVQYNGYFVSTVDADGLVLQHQGISSLSAGYTPMHFQSFMS